MSDQKEMSSTSELISQFEEAIRSSTERINDFVRRNNEGWTQVNTLTEQLKGLIDQLRSALYVGLIYNYECNFMELMSMIS